MKTTNPFPSGTYSVFAVSHENDETFYNQCGVTTADGILSTYAPESTCVFYHEQTKRAFNRAGKDITESLKAAGTL